MAEMLENQDIRMSLSLDFSAPQFEGPRSKCGETSQNKCAFSTLTRGLSSGSMRQGADFHKKGDLV
jgi:hypothetical protein